MFAEFYEELFTSTTKTPEHEHEHEDNYEPLQLNNTTKHLKR